MGMELATATPLWFLLLALPLVWFLPGRARSRAHAAVRTAFTLLLILALCRPVLQRDSDREHHVLLVDGSASVAAADRAEAAAVADAWQGPLSARGTVQRQGTTDSDLAGALARALAAVPPDARGSITLFSDGQGTRPRHGPVVQALQVRGLPVHAVQLRGPGAAPRVVALRSQDPVLRVGQAARLTATLVGQGRDLDARLQGPDGELARVPAVALDGRAEVTFTFEPERPGFLPLTVEVREGATAPGPDAVLTRTFAVQDPVRALYLGERVAEALPRLRELLGAVVQWEEAPPGDGPAPMLADHDLVVLDDRPASGLPESLQQELMGRVARGELGVLATGGPASFGPGGYHDTPLNALFPVEFVQKEEKRDPSTTLVVIIDTSGSMGGNRVQLAKEVARLAIRRLLPHDKVGIVEFYGAKRWAAPIQPASNSIELERALNRLDAGGGTVIMPAIEEAFYGLQNVQTRYKHVLVLTDGGVETGAFEPLLRRMADKGMNVSTVLIGPEAHSEFLVTLANWGKGRFYSVPNRFNLPEILLKQPASAKLPAYRPGPHALQARGGAGWWGEVDPQEVPDLDAYVETRSRPGSEVLLETRETRHPVLATWQFGAGRVTALTTEPVGPGTRSWQDWAGYGQFLGRVAARTAADRRDPWAYTLHREGHEVIVTARRQRWSEEPPVAALRTGADGSVELTFDPRAPGYAVARRLWDPAEPALVVAGHGTRLVADPFSDRSPERQVDPDRALSLAALATSTGGEAMGLADAAGFLPAAGGPATTRVAVRLWPGLLLGALLLFLADLWLRRRDV